METQLRKLMVRVLFDSHLDSLGFFSPFIVAMHTAASIAMRLCGQYMTTGRVNLEPGEMQNLMGSAISLLSK